MKYKSDPQIVFLYFHVAGPFTLFAPTDAAFRALPAGALDSLIANPEELKKVLLTHVVSGTVYSRGLSSGAVPVVAGGNVDADVARSTIPFTYKYYLQFSPSPNYTITSFFRFLNRRSYNWQRKSR